MVTATEYAASAARARELCRARGLADCIHYAPDWAPRANALYKIANDSGVDWWRDEHAGPGLLADGRMVLDSDAACWFEPTSTVREFRMVRAVRRSLTVGPALAAVRESV